MLMIPFKSVRSLSCVFLLSLLAVTLLCSSCRQGHQRQYIDLPQVMQTRTLTVLTINNAASYFSYRGEEMGFQYELAQQFAQSLDLHLEVKIASNEEELVRMLLDGEGDLIAYNLGLGNKYKDSLIYCGEENINHQVLVQRRGGKALRDVTQLVGQDVYVTPGRYADRMNNLNNELGGGINIHEINSDTVSAEQLVNWVSEGKIDYTVADNQLAQINKTYHPSLDIHLVVSFNQRSSWAVRKTSPLLAVAADKWHKENINSPETKASAKRYFEAKKHISHGSILSVAEGKISFYDDLFREYAKEIGWDWRTLAALVFTESNFNPDVVSWAGARGLMQLMPGTARAMGVPEGMEADPEQSIKAGVKYLAYLKRLFRKVPNEEDKIKFILAAYNAGAGHVTDAMALAEKYGANKYVWDHNVERYILLKSNEQYYRDPVCKNGYFRGTETYNFIHSVMTRSDIYKRKIKQ